MQTAAIDFYHPLMASGDVDEAHVSFDVPDGRVVLVEGAISTFYRLHVDAWLSLGEPRGKGSAGIFALTRTGDAGAGSVVMPVAIDIKPPLVLNYWAHNMVWRIFGKKDWHVGYILHYA